MMTSKMIALRVLDGIVVAFIATLVLSMTGFPMEWLVDMSSREFRAFSIFIVSAALWLMHAIAASDSAP
jgi:ABC-type spermidine/putrescine transport system permease subunit I